jgi:hypothetical protein
MAAAVSANKKPPAEDEIIELKKELGASMNRAVIYYNEIITV